MTQANIMVVDDDIEQCKVLEEVLLKEGYKVVIATSGEEAVQHGKESFFDIVISDIRMLELGMDGLALLRNFKQFSPKTIVILMTAFASLKTTIEAMENGAFDYISKPFRLEQIISIVKRALEESHIEAKSLKDAAKFEHEDDHMIGRDPAMNEVYKTIALAAKTPATILIQGETGTGKELIARQIHRNSDRIKESFLAINCSALPESLLESELFGYRKGAFTGAIEDRPGLFEKAKGGTVFLDEIGETTPSFQSKLLRVIEEQEIKRVGGTENIKIDVRIIAATNKNLSELVKAKLFRDDLLYRLNVITINIPPLRERIEDIPDLADYFLKKSNFFYGKKIASFSPDVMDVFKRYQWPGNVRELAHAIESAVALNTSSLILLQDLPPNITQSILEQDNAKAKGKSVQEGYLTLEEMEKNYILQVLKETSGNRNKTADILGIDRKTLYRKALKYGIDIDNII